MKLSADLKIFVAGHTGLAGSAITRSLQKRGCKNLILKSHAELDLRDQKKVSDLFKESRPDLVILAAARVGGIGANSTMPVEFLLENLQIQNNVISAAADFGAEKLVFLGSSCVYPKNAKYPLTEDQLLTSAFEPTNEAYALAKVAGIKLCQAYAKEYKKNFISVMPTNLYGPNDFYDLEKSHVLPAMVLKILKAKQSGAKSITFWGSGKPLREFMHSDDLADAVLVCVEKYDSPEIINIGSGIEISIKELAELICEVAGFTGQIQWDASRPDGVARKVMDSSKVQKLGWKAARQLRNELPNILQEAEKRAFQ